MIFPIDISINIPLAPFPDLIHKSQDLYPQPDIGWMIINVESLTDCIFLEYQ